jgi:hypothetical protein
MFDAGWEGEAPAEPIQIQSPALPARQEPRPPSLAVGVKKGVYPWP